VFVTGCCRERIVLWGEYDAEIFSSFAKAVRKMRMLQAVLTTLSIRLSKVHDNNGGQPSSEVLDGVRIRAAKAQPGFLHNVIGFVQRTEGETDERLFAVAVWRDAPYFTDAERRIARLPTVECAENMGEVSGPRPSPIRGRLFISGLE
jgi:hypothetical protein